MHGIEWVVDASGCDPAALADLNHLHSLFNRLIAELQLTPVTDPALLPAAVRRLDDAGVVIAELSLRNASLNEVFLSLTGHRAEEEPTQQQAEEVLA